MDVARYKSMFGGFGCFPFSLWVCVPPGPDFPKTEED